MKTTTTSNIVSFLSNLNGATICNLVYAKECKLNKRGNPLANESVTKLESLICQFGYNYESAVNNRLEKQGDERTFDANSLPWGEWVIPNKLIAHKGETYARFYVMQGGREETIYFVNGEIATEEQVATIKQFTPQRSVSNTQASEGLTQNQVKPFTINIKNIRKLIVNGVEFQVREMANQMATA